MASSQHRTATVCLACGDRGESKLLIYCSSCQDSAVHHYCLDNFCPDNDDIKWWCWDCREEYVIKAEPSRKSERICFKRQKAQNMRTYWKQKLNQKKKLARIREDSHKTGRVAIDGPESNLVNGRQGDLDVLEKEEPVPETVINSEHNESIRIDEPTVTIDSSLHDKQEHHVKSFDEPPEIPEFGNNEKILLLNDSDNAPIDGEATGLQVSLLVVDNFPSVSDALWRQPYSEPDETLSAEPIFAPVWRGNFNISEGSEICAEMLAHVSNKACWKVSDAAAAMPRRLVIKLLEKHTIWPKHFRDAPPTAASICLYFFPACERDERVYDSLLDEVIDGDLALKVVVHDLELLIFPSSELDLKHWRFNKKYFLWGVFKKTQRSYSSTDSAIMRRPEPIAIGSKEGLVGSQPPKEAYPSPVSPVSLKSSQASGMLPPSAENTPESLCFDPSKLGKAVGMR